MTRWTSGFITLFMLIMVPTEAADQAAPVEAVTTEQRTIYQAVQLTGTVTSPHTATLSAETSGLVATVHVDEGAQVEAGEVLLELDAELARLQLNSFIAKVEQSRIALQNSKRRLEEARILIPQKSIAESTVRDLEAEVARNYAALQQTTADMQYQQQLLARHSLTAPFAGVVSHKHTEKGEWVSPGDGVLELVATKNMRMDFYVAENYLAKLKHDTAVIFHLNSEPDKEYQGQIGAIVPVLDPAARTFLLRVFVDSAHSHFIPGMSASATLQVPTGREGIVVPKDALLRHRDGRVMVWTVEQRNEEWVAVERIVKTGVSFNHHIEIRDGLSLDERVVIRGNESLQSGQKVILIKFQGALQ